MIDEILALVREVHDLRFTSVERAADGQSGTGAFLALDANGRRVVLKWFEDESAAPRLERLARTLDSLRTRGYPAPAYGPVVIVPGATVAVQTQLPGRSGLPATAALVDRVLAINELQTGVTDAPLLGGMSWGALLAHSLVVGEDGYCMHEPVRSWSPRAAALLDRIEAIGEQLAAATLPVAGVVHYDLHMGNLLVDDDGSLTGVIDWEGASLGDPRFDLVAFGQHLEARGWSPLAAPLWRTVEATVAPGALRAYVAHIVLRLVDWQVRHTPGDVENQLDVGERLLGRYG